VRKVKSHRKPKLKDRRKETEEVEEEEKKKKKKVRKN